MDVLTFLFGLGVIGVAYKLAEPLMARVKRGRYKDKNGTEVEFDAGSPQAASEETSGRKLEE